MKNEALATIGNVHKDYEVLSNSFKTFVMTSSRLHPIDCSSVALM
jgi:hypothetical protein